MKQLDRGVIRVAARSDIPVLVEMMGEFYAESSYKLDEGWATASFGRLLGNRHLGAVWIAHRGRDPAGYVVLTTRYSMEFGGLDGFIDDLFVRPRFRRQGMATALLHALFQSCRGRHILAVHVETGRDNSPAKALYAAFGLVANGRELMTVAVKGPE